MRTRFPLLPALVAGLLGLPLALAASSPRFWTLSTQSALLAGELDSVSIDTEGRITLGPASELLYEGAEPAIWTMVSDGADGVLVGTGNQGQVVHVAGRGASRVVFDANELEVHALARSSDGFLYVGTSPDGRVYKLDRNDAAAPFFDPDDRYVWSLAFDSSGSLFVGTGDKGMIYKVDRNGRGVPFFDSKAKHVTALVVEGSGDLLVGTESPGRVFRVDREGKGFVLLDPGLSEIRAVRPTHDGVIFVAALNGGAAAPAAAPEPTAPEPQPDVQASVNVSTDITITAIGGGNEPAQPAPRPESSRAKGSVFRINADGLWDRVWESSEDVPYDMVPDARGDLLIATGSKGRLYRVPPGGGRSTLVTRAGGLQATALLPVGNAIFYTTSNPGKVFRLSGQPAERGTYLSPAQDASTGATWGLIRWTARIPAGASLQIATRSGNTQTPDDGWSDWSAPYTIASGDAIRSPKARYLQWRAAFSGKTSPELLSVTAAYLPRNLRPVVTSLTVHPAGVVFQRPFPTGDPELAGYDSGASDGKVPVPGSATAPAAAAGQGLGRRLYQKGFQTLAWKADDENGDRLTYAVWYRREGDVDWRLLKRDLWDTIYTWDTTNVPDGTYTVRVVASDAPSNADALALSGERDSPTFDIDNTPPTIADATIRREANRSLLRFVVRDTQSTLDRVELSIDAAQWRTVYPVDGIADGREERYEIDLGTETGAVQIRATDALNNVSAALVEAAGTPRRRDR